MTTRSRARRHGKVWSIVLAAGSGSRLRNMVTEGLGIDCPKQYCGFNGGRSLLRQAVDRALMLTTHERVVPVVAAEHQMWWRRELADLPPENIVVQPCNRGTACGLLLPLTHILLRDPLAVVVALPSDHLVENEDTLIMAAYKGVSAVRSDNESVVLLGMEPESADSDLGWIAPSMTTDRGLRAVLSFVEKPSPEVARQLLHGGGLLNGFVFVARGLTLLSICEKASPGIVERFGAAVTRSDSRDATRRIDSLYQHLPTLDLSRDVLQSSVADLRVIPVPPCGWTDLGTPERVLRQARGESSSRCDLPSTRVKEKRGSSNGPPDLALAAHSYLARHSERTAH